MTIVFSGDFCIAAQSKGDFFCTKAAAMPFQELKRRFGTHSIIVGNLECAITHKDAGRPYKWANLRMNPESSCHLLNELTVAVLGNNHIGDFGVEGVFDTVNKLAEQNISYVGIGGTLSDAIDYVVVHCDGIRVGLISLCCPTTNSEYIATHESPGVAPISMGMIDKALSRCKSKADLCIIYLHWGCEWVHDPAPDQLRLARHAIDCGADAVLGCHSHTIQSYEQYKGKWIFYGLGNYCFDAGVAQAPQPDGSFQEIPLTLSPNNKESLVVSFKVREVDNCATLELDQIQPFKFDDDFLPVPCNEDQLTFDLSAANKRLMEYVNSNPEFLDKRHEVEYRCLIRNGVMAYWYQNESITALPHKSLKREVANAARSLIGRLKKSGTKAINRYLA
jgi:hypothetical protein